MYRICILRHKLKMIWFSINKAEGNIQKDYDNTDEKSDEESKSEAMSEGAVERKQKEILALRETAKNYTETLETYIEKLINDKKEEDKKKQELMKPI